MKQWHPRTTLWGAIGFIIVFVSVIWTMHLLGKKYGDILWRVGQGADQGKEILTGVGLAVGSVLIVIYSALVYFTTKLFPNLVFRIGDGVTRHDSIRAVRSRLFWLILSTAGVGLLFRVVTAFLF